MPAVPPPPHRDHRSEGDAMDTEMIATPHKSGADTSGEYTASSS
ncbi:hypothetical protein [Acaryochloris sp. 'Moss Beach']|nr:hypothetical protein [Acaryochloris sp. 'Moss Beach']